MNFPITVKSEYDEETVKAPQPITVVAASMHDADVILSLSDSCRIHYDTSIANHPGNIAYKKLVNLNRDLISSSSSEKRQGDDESTYIICMLVYFLIQQNITDIFS